jgi:hypothetical protein
MPDTFLGLALFVALLAPGICFVLIREARVPQRELSALRETAAIALVSFAADTIVLIGFGIFRSRWPDATPDVPELIDAPKAYISGHLALVGWWALGLLLVACLIAVLVATRAKLDTIRLGPIQHVSAWYRLLHPGGSEKFCGCFLDDESWVGGYVSSFSTDVDETGDRDLVLSAPIRYRAKGWPDATVLPNVSAFVVSASHIVGMQVSLVPVGTAALDRTAQAEETGRHRRGAS